MKLAILSIFNYVIMTSEWFSIVLKKLLQALLFSKRVASIIKHPVSWVWPPPELLTTYCLDSQVWWRRDQRCQVSEQRWRLWKQNQIFWELAASFWEHGVKSVRQELNFEKLGVSQPGAVINTPAAIIYSNILSWNNETWQT